MGRLQELELNNADESQREVLALLPPLKLFRVMAHAPQAAMGFATHGARILYETALDPVWRELVILVVAHRLGSDYEIQEHERIAREVGCPGQKIAALRSVDCIAASEAFTQQEKALASFALQMLDDQSPDNASYAAVAEFLSPQELVELVLCVAFYQGAALFMSTFGIEPEADDFTGGVSMESSPPEL